MKKDVLLIVLFGVLFVALFTAVPYYLGVEIFVYTLISLIFAGVIFYGAYLINEEKKQEIREKEFYRSFNN